MSVASFTSTVDGDDAEDVESDFEEEGLDIIFQASKTGGLDTDPSSVLHFIRSGEEKQ
jgi:hypothetical protein